MRFLLRPAWLVLIVAVVGFAVAAVTLLAPWQFGREAQRDAQQGAIDAASAVGPLPLGQVLPRGIEVGPGNIWRQVELTGTYLPQAQGLVRLRVVDGRPAFEVLTAFRTDDGRLLAVNRGTVAAPEGRTVPDFPAPPVDPVTVTGRLRTNETDPQGRTAFSAQGHRQLYAADSRTLAADTGLDLERGVVALGPGQPGVLNPLPVAPSTGGAPFTNLSYALQWLTFGAVAIVALGIFIRLELMQRSGGDRRAQRSAVRQALAGDDEDRTPLAR